MLRPFFVYQTIAVTLVVRSCPPPTPVIRSVKIPEELPGVIVTTEIAPLGLGVTGLLLNVAVMPCGNPLTPKLTGELKPADDATCSANVPGLFRRKNTHLGPAMLKLPGRGVPPIGAGVSVAARVAATVGVGGFGVALRVAAGVGEGGAVPPHPGIALQTLRRPPVIVLPVKLVSESTLFRIRPLNCSGVKLPCPGADRIKAAAPATCGVAIEVPLK